MECDKNGCDGMGCCDECDVIGWDGRGCDGIEWDVMGRVEMG